MESLLPSPTAGSPAIRVPFLPTFRHHYVSDGFKSLKGVYHVTEPYYEVKVEDIASFDLQERASCLQAWLFFGLISEFFEQDVAADPAFVQKDPDDEADIVNVYPTTIDVLFIDWATKLSHLPDLTRDAKVRKTSALIDFASEQCDGFDDTRYKCGDLESGDLYNLAAILVSIKLLVSYLRSRINAYFQSLKDSSSSRRWLDSFISHSLQSSSIKLGDIFSNAGKIVGSESHTKMPVPMPPGGKESLTFWLLYNRFKSNHWCPIRARQLCRAHDYLIANYLSRVQRSGPQVSHQNCEFAVHCEAYNVKDESTYEPKHTTPDCTCYNVMNRAEDLMSAIEDGYIPILSIDMQSTSPTLDMKLHRQTGDIPYIAISHVWSDGLGNPHENSLPLCQLARLGAILSEMNSQQILVSTEELSGKSFWNRQHSGQRVYFWMDTFCIPVTSPCFADRHSLKLKKLKQRAIRHITPIFQMADQILVLDAELELMQLNASNAKQRLEMTVDQIRCDEEELAAGVLGCKWLQRAWTLEEGALAQDCHFKMSGANTMTLGELVPSHLISSKAKTLAKRHVAALKKREKKERKKKKKKKKQEANDPEMQMSLLPDRVDGKVIRFDPELKILLAGPLNESRKQAARPGQRKRDLQLFTKSRPKQFADAWNNLLERSATKSEDPILIFANILDFNSASVAGIPLSDRLPMVIKSCEELPLSLLFQTKRAEPSRASINDAWIPTSIEGDRLVHNATMKRWKGSATFAGLEIQIDQASPDSIVIFYFQPQISTSSSIFRLEIQNESDFGPYVIELLPQRKTNLDREIDLIDEGVQACLLLDRSLGTESINGYTARGALTRLLAPNMGSNKHTTFMRYNCAVRVWTYKQWQFQNQSSSLPGLVIAYQLSRDPGQIILEHDIDSWTKPLKQRGLLPPPSLTGTKRRVIIAYLFACALISLVGLLTILVLTRAGSSCVKMPPRPPVITRRPKVPSRVRPSPTNSHLTHSLTRSLPTKTQATPTSVGPNQTRPLVNPQATHLQTRVDHVAYVKRSNWGKCEPMRIVVRLIIPLMIPLAWSLLAPIFYFLWVWSRRWTFRRWLRTFDDA